ncbi:MAG: 2-succinyl-5-enolpyruvyl-6-hydroxy-3-cyclohexene-1-carboxylic-acid synthase [Phycisphaerales bacterium]|nr:2-succinyl-5-enolpyruvyl-6-hydroxy-3-cyclohexene-1-carboxylic-acid synthase [Phycisphaerales bacterium]
MSAPRSHFDPAGAPNINALWTQLAFEEWSRLGVSLAVVCPGSRSAALAYAVSQNSSIDAIIVHDERAAGFAALGAARATGRAAAVITTSGTAVANLLPAVVEASKTGTPLLVVTADRPPELHDCGANQSISQSRIFGSFVRWSLDLPCADSAIDASWLLSTVDEAWYRAHGPSQSAGPVHVNWPFREPLAPRIEAWDRRVIAGLEGWAGSRAPWRTSTSLSVSMEGCVERTVESIIEAAQGARRVLLCVGALYSPTMRSFARALAQRLACPVLADIASGLRHGGCVGEIVAHGDLIVLSKSTATSLLPDFCIRLGGALSSRRIHEFLADARRSGCRELVIRDGRERQDFEHSAAVELSIDTSIMTGTCQAHSASRATRSVGEARYTALWAAADGCVCGSLHEHLDAPDAEVDEPSTARMVAALCPSEATLFFGNSMPIRDGEMHAGRVDASPTVAANRGASGIDGLIATAVGHARATKTPSIVLIGDLSLLHDLGSLALVRGAGVALVIVVVNNDGGGIFHFLPLADHPALLEPWTAAPHGLCFESAAQMFGLHYHAPTARGDLAADLKEAVRIAVDSGQSSLIEVKTERRENVRVHRTIQNAVLSQLERAETEARSPAAEAAGRR